MGRTSGIQGSTVSESLQVLDLTEKEFLCFSRLVYEQAGINLHQGKKELLRARLAKRIKELGFGSFSQYYEHLVGDGSKEELLHMLDSVATNLTRFFREEAHFHFLAEKVYPEFQEALKKGTQDPLFRVWSAACSTGEEPFSIAIHLGSYLGWDFHVWATDISTKALEKAKRGIYPLSHLSEVPSWMLRRFFLKGRGPREGYARLKPEIRSRVSFQRHNLMDPPPFQEEMDVVFCRNVLIYFDRPTQKKVVESVSLALKPGGYLLVGHAESLNGAVPQLRYVRPAVYRKP